MRRWDCAKHGCLLALTKNWTARDDQYHYIARQDARKPVRATMWRMPPTLKRVVSPVWGGLEDQPPVKWRERLAQITREGRKADADELLSEFRRRFSDHPDGVR